MDKKSLLILIGSQGTHGGKGGHGKSGQAELSRMIGVPQPTIHKKNEYYSLTLGVTSFKSMKNENLKGET